MLSDQLISDFQNLYLQHYGVQISKEEALTKGLQLIGLVAVTNKLDDKQHEKRQNDNNFCER